MPRDPYEFMAAELDSLRIGLDSLHAERDQLMAEVARLTAERAEVVRIAYERGIEIEWYNKQLGEARRDLAETRERLAYHMRIASDWAAGRS